MDVVSSVAIGHRSTGPHHDRVGEGLELLATARAVEALPRPPSVVERRPPGSARARRSRPRGRARPRASRPRAPARTTASICAASRSGRVGVPSRRSVPGTLPVSIVSPVQSRMSSAIWNAIPSSRPYSPLAAAEQARRLEQLPRLERAALEIGLDRRLGIVALPPLQRLAAREREARVGENGHRGRVAGLRRARRTRGRRGSRRPRARRRRRAPSTPRPGRAGRARRRSGRRGRASPGGRARPRHRPRAAARRPSGAER